MVGELSILGMHFSKWISLFIPIFLVFFLKLKYDAKLKTYFIGTLAFIVGAVIIPSIIQTLLQLIGIGKSGVGLLIIVAIVTALCQESAKMIALKKWFKNIDLLDVITFGAGFTGVQSAVITTMNCVGFIETSKMINEGKFFSTYSQMQVSEFAIKQVKELYVNTHYLNWWLIGIQVITITAFHIAMTNLIYKSIKDGNNKYYFIAVIIDAMLIIGSSLTLVSAVALSVKAVLLIIVTIVSIVYTFKLLKEEKIIGLNK